MPDATITSTASTFGTISGTFAADQSTVTGTVTGIITGTLSGSVGVPGPQGAPGVGVPAGGTAGQFLTKIDGTNYNTDWTTVNLTGLATESWVTAGFYPLTGNPSGFLTSSALTPYLTKADNLASVASPSTARTNLGLGSLDTPTFAGVNVPGSGTSVANLGATFLTINQQGSGQFTIQPSQGIVFPDATVQTTAYPGPVGATTWGSITGTLSSQTDLQTALDGKYSTSNPAGYITSSALAGYATESWVTAGFYPLSSNPAGYLTSAPVTSVAGRTGAITLSNADISGLGSLAVVNDAPSDGSQYARKNGAWDVVAAAADFISSVSSPLAVTTGNLTIDLSAYAPLASPAFTGSPTAPTPSPGTDSTRIATTEWVKDLDYAPLNSPQFNGNPRGPTPSLSDNDTSLATTEFVKGQNYITSSALSPYLTTATAASTYAPLASPALTGNPTAPTPATADNDTSIATTAFVKAQGYLTTAPVTSVAGRTGAVTLAVADVSGAAPTASPTFTGTPSLPTGTTAVTQTAGNNTTAVATTAFVQQEVPAASTTAAGKVELATFDEAILGASTTIAPTAFSAKAAIMSADWMPVYRFGFTATTSGTGAACTLGYTNTFYQLPTSGSTGHSYARTYGLSQVDQLTNLWGDDANVYVNFAKRIWISGRSVITFSTTAYGVHRVSFGKAEATGVGDLAARGIGWKYTTGSSQFVQLMVHNGTTLTTVNSSFTPGTGAFDWDIVSEGNGNVTLYINGASVATTSAGPSTRATSGQCLYQEEAVVNGTIPNAFCRLYCARGAIYVQR
jgi:hypothetical protein